MAMMCVGIVRMRVHEPLMAMPVAVRLSGRVVHSVFVLVMVVVHVRVLVFNLLMNMGMLMPLADVEPDAEAHQGGGNPERGTRALTPERERRRRADERRE